MNYGIPRNTNLGARGRRRRLSSDIVSLDHSCIGVEGVCGEAHPPLSLATAAAMLG